MIYSNQLTNKKKQKNHDVRKDQGMLSADLPKKLYGDRILKNDARVSDLKTCRMPS